MEFINLFLIIFCVIAMVAMVLFLVCLIAFFICMIKVFKEDSKADGNNTEYNRS